MSVSLISKQAARPLPATTLLVEDGLAQSDSFEELRCMVSCALQNQCRVEQNDADCYCWIQNMYPGDVVYSMEGKYYQRSYKLDASDNVTFGAAAEVEMSWAPVSAQESAGSGRKVIVIGESNRALCVAVQQLSEAYNSQTGELTMTVIKPGFNLSKEKYYPPETLRRDYRIFEGAKMFADHQTVAEAKARPEGSVHNWVASVSKVWAESDGRIRATAQVIDPPFKAKLDTLNEKKLLGEMGISIRAIGVAQPQKIDNVETAYVESLLAARSVDFVTYAGAGGQVEAIESAQDDSDVDLISVAQLRSRRPDLVSVIESAKELLTMKSVEQQLQEAQTALAAEKTRADNAEAKFQEAEKQQKRATAAAELTKLLSESQLPEKAQERIRANFKEAVDVTGMKEAITAEKEYIKSFGAPVATKGTKVANMGSKENGTAEAEGGGDGEVKKTNLVESFQSLGMTEAEAKIAASV